MSVLLHSISLQEIYKRQSNISDQYTLELPWCLWSLYGRTLCKRRQEHQMRSLLDMSDELTGYSILALNLLLGPSCLTPERSRSTYPCPALSQCHPVHLWLLVLDLLLDPSCVTPLYCSPTGKVTSATDEYTRASVPDVITPRPSTISHTCKSVIWIQLTFKVKFNYPHF